MEKMTTATGKATNRPQPTLLTKPAGVKTAKDSIQVRQKQPPATADTDNAQDPGPSQTTGPKRAATQEPPTTKTSLDWSTAEEGDAAFSKSNIVV